MAPVQPLTGPAGEVLLPYPAGPWDPPPLGAVSGDELWVSAWIAEDQTRASLFRYRGDGWQEVQPDVPLCDQPANFFPDYAAGPAAVVATDGAIWTKTSKGLARYVDDSPQVITVGARGCVAFPGPDTGVWLRSDPGFVLATPQGAGSPVPLPRDLAVSGVCSWAAGPDGTVLVSTPAVEDEGRRCYMLPSSLRLWEGSSWRSIDPPDPQAPVWGVLVTDDGAAWAISHPLRDNADDADTLSRYDDGEWTTIDPAIGYPLAVRAGPAGTACVLSHHDNSEEITLTGTISCYDSAGRIGDLTSTLEVFDFSVAPDGAIWGADDYQIVRLAEQLPTR